MRGHRRSMPVGAKSSSWPQSRGSPTFLPPLFKPDATIAAGRHARNCRDTAGDRSRHLNTPIAVLTPVQCFSATARRWWRR